MKCLIVKELSGMQNVKFLYGDLIEYLSARPGGFDAIFCSGVMYHMTDPESFYNREDLWDIAKRTGAPVVAIVEVANELGEQGLENVFDPNLGGTVEFDWGWVRLVPAWHTGTTPNGTAHTPAGLVISLGGSIVYHLGDTALFSDIRLPGERDSLDVALVPIGGHYTMDRQDAVIACEWIGARVVIPCHYDTFPPIETDAEAFKSEVEERTGGKTTVELLEPGGTFSP